MANDILKEKINEATLEIKNILRTTGLQDNYFTFSSIVFLLYKASIRIDSHDLSYNDVLSTLNENERMVVMDSMFLRNHEVEIWEQVKGLSVKYTPAVFAQILLNTDDEKFARSYGFIDRPKCFIGLLEEILDIHDGEKFLETSCGIGDTLIALSQKYDCKFTAYEVDSMAKGIASIRYGLLNKACTIINRPFLHLEHKRNLDVKPCYDKILSMHPLGLRAAFSGLTEEGYVESINNEFCYPILKSGTSLDWLYAIGAEKALADNGKAVLLVADGCLMNGLDEQPRRYFVENGLLEAVISLPPKIFSVIGVNLSLLVLSKGNKYTRLVNARKFYQPGRRQNIMSAEDISKIMDAYHNGGKYTVDITAGDIQPNSYSLSPERYMAVDTIDLKNPVPLASVVDSFGRTAPLNAAQLDELASDEPTDIKYVRLADVQDNMVNKELPYLKAVDKKYEKYFLENDDMLLSKNGYPFKVAIVKVAEGEKILPVGNMHVLKVNKNKIDIVYLKAFLESSKGIGLLKSVVSGTTIPVVNLASLKKMPIELPTMEQQKKITEKYKTISDEIALLKLKIERANDRLARILDEEDGE